MKLLKIDELVLRTGLSKATIYAEIADGAFPRPVKIGKRRVAWIKKEVSAWIVSRPRTTYGCSDDGGTAR